MEIKQRLLSILNTAFDSLGSDGGQDEIVYFCPFCNHHKKKLQVNVVTQQWHCWVCDAKGKSIFTLAKKLKASKAIYTELEQIFKNSKKFTFSNEEKQQIIRLPEEFLTLKGKNEALSFNQAKSYLKKRNIEEHDIIRYNIGYCTDGVYGGRIIIPSYDSNGVLNYFIARSFYNSKLKYKNPPVPKNTVIFDLYINWNMPVILCEGVFDAIAIKRNAIPLLGKTIQDSLLSRLVSSKVSEVIIALDSDAKKMISVISKKLKKWNLKVSRVELSDSDPSDVGFKGMQYTINKRVDVTDYDLILQRINI
jgi:DNA primase